MKENYLTKAKAIKIKNEAAGLFNHQKIEFNPDSSALLVLDMQKFFADKGSHAYIPSIDYIIPNISGLINHFKHVIFTKHINTEENAGLMGKWWKDIIKQDSIVFNTESHTVIQKSQYDAFYNTGLEGVLNGLNAKSLVITGVMTHLCCETTARSAFVRGFNTFFVIDGTATYNERFHRGSVYNLAHGFAVPVLAEEIINRF